MGHRDLLVAIWNADGLTPAKLELCPDLLYAFRQQHFVLVTETRSNASLTEAVGVLFPHHVLFEVPQQSGAGRRGGGLCILVHSSWSSGVRIWRSSSHTQSLWLRVPGPPCRLDRDLFVAVAYIPPAASVQHANMSVTDRFSQLTSDATQAAGMGHVILGGDFNARVGSDWREYPQLWDTNDPSLPPLSPTSSVTIPRLRAFWRGYSDSDGHGRQLMALGCAAQLHLWTGRFSGDVPVRGSFLARGRAAESRPDHVLATALLTGAVTRCHISEDTYGSDHAVLWYGLRVPVSSSSPALNHTMLAPKLVWRTKRQLHYQVALARVMAVSPLLHAHQRLRLAPSPVPTETLTACMDAIIADVRVAATAAGCTSRQRTPHHRDKVWFSTECRNARSEVLRAVREGLPLQDVRAARRHFTATCREAKHAHRLHGAWHMVQALRRQPQRLWNSLLAPRVTRQPNPTLTVQYLRDHFGAAFCSPPLPPDLHDSASGDPLLDSPFTVDEVNAAIRLLKNGKSPGPDGVPGEFIKYGKSLHTGEPLLGPALTDLYNAILRDGTIPDHINDASLTLLYKRGDDTLPDNYRPIAMLRTVGKILAMLVRARLDRWVESKGLRSPAQGGNRVFRGTEHQCFVLRHFIDACAARGETLYAAFLDLTQAFDKVHRAKLWQQLHQIGIRGPFLRLVAGLYHDVVLHIRVHDATAEVPTSVGVRQGCPLSPLLFGLYVDDLHEFLISRCPNVGPLLGRHGMNSPPVHAPDLMFADDTTLLALTATGLQELLDAFELYCMSKGLVINMTKSVIVVFRQQHTRQVQPQHAWTFAGQLVPVADSAVYLGLQFHGRFSATKMMLQRRDKARVALGAMNGKYAALDIPKCPRLLFRLFDCLVMTVLLYGCEVWGPQFATPSARHQFHGEQVHVHFLRALFGLRATTSTMVVYRECGRYPLFLSIARRCVSFYDKLLSLPCDAWPRMALVDNVWDSRGLSGSQTNWAWQFRFMLREFGFTYPIRADPQPLSLPLFWTACVAWLHKCWHDIAHLDPRAATCADRHMVTYHKVVASPLPSPPHKWLASPHVWRVEAFTVWTSLVVRLRCGNHKLAAVVGGWEQLPLSRRTCRWCNSGVLEDVQHVLWECMGPALSQSRAHYLGDVREYCSVQDILARAPASQLGRFLRAIGCV